MIDIELNLACVQKHIHTAEKKHHRKQGTVSLIAVSKTKPQSDVQQAIDAGQYAFGENYVQEAIQKIESLNHPALEWHFLGPIQSNKTRLIAENFDWVHSVDRLKIAQRLNEQRPSKSSTLNICLQVNISEETSKSGVNEASLSALVESILLLPKLKLRGFMVIPQKTASFDAQRKPFFALRKLKEKMEQRFDIVLDTLSMGMSADLEAAVAEGASHVRIGTDIFGSRN